MLRILILALSAALAVSSVPAQAQLVTNGGFETGDFTGWTRNPIGTCIDQVNAGSARSGSYGLLSSPFNSVCFYSQSIATTVGQQYDFSFWIANLGFGSPSSFEAFWDSQSVFSLTNPAPTAYSQKLFSVTATSTTTYIDFVIRDESHFYMLDDVSVVQSGTSTVVPEPSSLVLMAAGLFGLMATAYRRRVS